ncbi:unnamed protein product, partial [Eruca vesicaria subsp. sativa]|nr:unnamed protein product [Eruca vesicaria subsp. sativa]
MFIILGDAGKELTGRRATELIDKYAEENGGDGAEHEVPQTHKFRIKVAHFNFTSKILPAVRPPKDRPADMPALPPASEVDISVVTESSGGGSPYANSLPSSTEEQQKPKRPR